MSLEPALFDSPMFETANEAFLFCKLYLEKKGHVILARRLDGIAPINNRSVGRFALQMLRALRTEVHDDSVEYVNIATGTVARAIGVPAYSAAS